MKPDLEIKAVLIDPFQCEIYPVAVRRDCASDLHALLDCETVQAININLPVNKIEHFVWVDDEGLLRQPFAYPQFILQSIGHGLTGYGLITGVNEHGSMVDCQISIPVLVQVLGFEQWRTRIRVDDVIPQMLRLYKLA